MESNTANSARFRSDGVHEGVLRLAIEGHLDVDTTGGIWREATNTIVGAKSRRAVLDASKIDYCDGSGIALLAQLGESQAAVGEPLEIHGLRPEFQELLEDLKSDELRAEQAAAGAATGLR